MIPGSFEYHRPASLADAIGLKTGFGDEGLFLAGGHSLTPMMKLRLAQPEHLIDLQAIDELKQIGMDTGTITIGSMTTQSELIESPLLAEHCPIIRETALQIADPQIRNLGTLGGNLANGDPGNDMPALMQALDASITLSGQSGSRDVAARDFYQGIFTTAREENEILSAVKIPVPDAGHGYAYVKQKRKIGDYATAAAAVLLSIDNGRCTAASLALTNLGDTPLYAADASQALLGSGVDQSAIDSAVNAATAIVNPASDGRGPAEFRTHVAGVMVRRAIQQALSRA